MGLFSKETDYNLELDEVLDNKYFSSTIKNLLLSTIYKIEISYEDFSKVKPFVRKKQDLLNELVETIRLYCDNIKVVKIDSDQDNILDKNNLLAVTNSKERSLLCYSTEFAMLYAISDISPKYFFVRNDLFIKKLLQETLVDGYNINNLEILMNFNGWSWDYSNNNYNFINNLIYQNLLMMLGEKFLYEWRTYASTRRDFLEEANDYIKIFVKDNKYFEYIFKLIYLNASGNNKNELSNQIREKKRKLYYMSDKIKYIDSCQKKKNKITKKIEKIDFALNDKNILKKEFEKTNSKLENNKKFKTYIEYKNKLIEQKNSLLNEVKEISYLLIPKNFIEYKKKLENEVKKYEELNFDEVFEKSQIEFLDFIEKKLLKIKTRDELIEVVYLLRYYKTLKYKPNEFVLDNVKIEDKYNAVFKKVITKLCKIGALKIFSMDINLNSDIIQYALESKVIELEKIKILFDTEEDGLIIKVYDKDTFEKQGRKKIDLKKNSLEYRKNRKIKLFN